MFYGLSKFIKQLLPKQLFYRSLLIVALPIVILQVTISIVFFDSLWIKTNIGMTRALVGEIKTFIDSYNREDADKYLYENYIVSEEMLKKCEGRSCNWLEKVKNDAQRKKSCEEFNKFMEDHAKGIGSCCKWHFGKKRKVKNKKPKIENKVIKNILPALNNQKLSMTNSTSYLKNRIKKIK